MDESTKDKIVPPKRSRLDYVDSAMAATIETAINKLVPGAGSPAMRLFNYVFAPPFERRLDQWRNTVAERILQLESKDEGFKVENLVEDQLFLTVLMQATQIALRNHQKEKLEALQNAVVNVARGSDLEEDQKLMFLNFIDSFTPLHLKLLEFLDDPGKYAGDNIVRTTISDSVIHVLETVFPELGEQKAIYYPVLQDLFSRGLLIRDQKDLHIGLTARNVFSSQLTPLGKNFLKYIRP